VTIGDEPLDLLAEGLEGVRKAYREEFDREPTHAEVARTVEVALRAVLDAASANAKIDAAVKIRAKPMKKQRVQAGDVFVIKLDRYHYGRILLKQGAGTLVEFFRQTSAKPLAVAQVKCEADNIKHRKFVFPIYFEDFRWKVIGNLPVAKDYPFPDVLYGVDNSLYAQNLLNPKKWWKPTPAQIKKLRLEPHVIFRREVYEENLRAGREDPWPEMLDTLRDRGVKG
jgi:hypothetical protein